MSQPKATSPKTGGGGVRFRSTSREIENLTANEDTNTSAVFANPNYGKTPKNPTNPMPDYLRLILTAQGIYKVASETPLQHAPLLSNKIENIVLLKREDLQPVFSFKIRGAYNKISHLTPEERSRGVIACSAGNHAQGVALSATKLNIKSTIVMPLTTPAIKYENVTRLGGAVVLAGKDFFECKMEAARLEKLHGMTNVPPYDDPYVIAGQGTIAMEIMRQVMDEDIDAIFVPVGGGGLLAGISYYVKRVSPSTKVIGVETFDADALTQSLRKGENTTLGSVGLFADGTAVRRIGDYPYDVCCEFVDETILVTTDEICAAIQDAFEDTRSLLEPSGALSVAGLKRYAYEKKCTGKRFVAVLSGANISFDRLRFVSERTYLGQKKEVLITVVMPEKAGMFLELYRCIAPRQVSEFSYRYSSLHDAYIFMAFKVKDRELELPQILDRIKGKGMSPLDVSHDEVAKTHVRHLIGGKVKVPDERLFRFSFPEVPGALGHFLTSLHNPLWNISLFHYRNVGGDVAKILVGIQVPENTLDEFAKFLLDLDYPYVEETDNEVYQTFLS